MVPLVAFLFAGRLIARFGPGRVIAAGSTIFAAGMAWWAVATALRPDYISQMLGGTIAGLRASDVGGIAFWAHVGGFASGVLLHRLFLAREEPRRFHPDEAGVERAWAHWP